MPSDNFAVGRIGRIKNMKGHPLEGKQVKIITIADKDEAEDDDGAPPVLVCELLEDSGKGYRKGDEVHLNTYEFDYTTQI